MKIKIKNKNYIGQCNALSYIFYKKIFKVNIFEDLENLRKSLTDIFKNDSNQQDVINFYEILLRLIYMLIYTRNQDIEDFEKWSKDIEIKDLTEELIDKTIEISLESFADEEVAEELEKIPGKETKNNIFPEHEFIRICLDYGLSVECLKKFTYIDIMKIFISSYKESKENKKQRFREATQDDWDKLASL